MSRIMDTTKNTEWLRVMLVNLTVYAQTVTDRHDKGKLVDEPMCDNSVNELKTILEQLNKEY